MTDWLERHMIPCPVKKVTGLPCPGCGMQRSIIEILRGNVVESFTNYPALIPLIIMVIYLALHLKFDFRNGAKTLKYFFIFNSIIISLNYVYILLNN